MPRAFPGPPRRFPLGELNALRRERLGFLTHLFATYGDVVRFWVASTPIVMVLAPEGVERVLQENARNYTKQTPGFDVVRQLLGEGLLTSEGSFWLRQRRLSQPAFHRQRLHNFAELMVDAAETLAAEWGATGKPGQVVDVSDGMMRFALRVVSRALFGEDLESDARTISDALTVALHEANDRITHPLRLPLFIPTPSNLRAGRAHRALDEVVHRLIDRRRRGGGLRHDLLAMLMEAKDEETGESMSDGQLRDEVMTLLLAGHETSANALSWIFALLSRHPEVRKKLLVELQAVLGGRRPAFDDWTKLVYTRQVIDEALRLYPPAWAISRRAVAPDELAGFSIPEEQIVFLVPFLTHRHPEHWEHPEAFDPDRFSPEKAKGRLRFSYLPFGGGPRGCIGNLFALMELTFALAVLVPKFSLQLLPGEQLGLDASITLRPEGGLRMQLS